MAGRPPKAKPDQEWAKAELARLDRDAAYFRGLGKPEHFEPLEARAAELRAAVTMRKWRADKHWKTWKQRQSGMLHTQTYDPLEARQLALRIAVGRVSMLFAAQAMGEAAGADSDVYKMAESACGDAADTLGNPRTTVPLSRVLQLIQERMDRHDLPDRVEFLSNWQERLPSLLVVEFATGASLDTLMRLFP